MANNLLKNQYPVIVFDLNKEVVAKLQASGARVAASPKEIAAEADQIITMLPSSPHVLSVYCGDEGILRTVRKGALLIDSSTIDPNVARSVAAQVREKGASLLDAPVSGGVPGAEAGTLTFMVGGEKDDFERGKILLQNMGKNIVHCGGSGNGQVVKLCNNLVLAISMVGVSEAMNMGIKLGMDPKTLGEVLSTSTARCWSVDTYNPVPGVKENVPSSRGYTGGFGVDLMLKDLGLAVDAAKSVDAPVNLGDLAKSVYADLSKKGAGKSDFSVVYDFLSKNK